MNKFIPEYLEDFNEGLKKVCEKLDLILDAIYGEETEEPTEPTINNEEIGEPEIALQTTPPSEDNEEPIVEQHANNKPIAEKKKRGRQPKK